MSNEVILDHIEDTASALLDLLTERLADGSMSEGFLGKCEQYVAALMLVNVLATAFERKHQLALQIVADKLSVDLIEVLLGKAIADKALADAKEALPSLPK